MVEFDKNEVIGYVDRIGFAILPSPAMSRSTVTEDRKPSLIVQNSFILFLFKHNMHGETASDE